MRGGTTTFFSRVDHHTQTYQAATTTSAPTPIQSHVAAYGSGA
jgi:hypothetical protein